MLLYFDGFITQTVNEQPVEKAKPEPPKLVLKSVDDIAKEVINGKWGSGSTRKQKLAEAGYDYSTVQKRVNEILK